MEESFHQWLIENDERAIDDAFFNDECSHFFSVDWREDDADIVQYCADCLGIDSMRAEWQGDTLVIICDDNETIVPLANDEGDRDITIRTLNDVLQPHYEIRLLACSHGSDTAGFAVLPASDWQSLDSGLPETVNANFIRLSMLPNIFTEMNDDHLPEAARLRFQRMIERNRRP
jgi:hypothetical protein